MLLDKWTGQNYEISLEKNPVSSDYCDYWDFYVRCVKYGDVFIIPHTSISHRKMQIIHKHYRSLKSAMNYIQAVIDSLK